MSKVEYLIIGIQYLLAPSFPVLSIDVIVNNFSEWQTTLIEDVICATLMDFEACCWQQTFGRPGKLFAGENVVWKRTREEFSIAVKVKVVKVPSRKNICKLWGHLWPPHVGDGGGDEYQPISFYMKCTFQCCFAEEMILESF